MEQLVARQAHNLEVARSNPASATLEGMTPVIRLITFCLSVETRHRTDENMNDALVALANNVKKCFLQLKKSSDLKR